MIRRYILKWNFSTLENNKNYTQEKEFINMTTLNAFLDASKGEVYEIYNYEIIDKVEIAINNIFKESGYEVIEITNSTIVASKFDERKYTYTIDDDVIIIKNRTGQIVFEKFISSYQEPFSFMIVK